MQNNLMPINKSLFDLFKESTQNCICICEKLKNTDYYKCNFNYGFECNSIFDNNFYREEIHDIKIIENFFGELGAIKYYFRISNHKNWIIMDNDLDKIFTFGENDNEFHIIRIYKYH